MSRVILPVMFDPDVDGVSDVVGGGVTYSVPLFGPKTRQPSKRRCDECGEPHQARGFCAAHYWHLYRKPKDPQ